MQQVLALGQQHVAAAGVEEARAMLQARIRSAMEAWVAAVGPSLAELDPDQCCQVLQAGIDELLNNLAASPTPSCTAGENYDDSDPDKSEDAKPHPGRALPMLNCINCEHKSTAKR